MPINRTAGLCVGCCQRVNWVELRCRPGKRSNSALSHTYKIAARREGGREGRGGEEGEGPALTTQWVPWTSPFPIWPKIPLSDNMLSTLVCECLYIYTAVIPALLLLQRDRHTAAAWLRHWLAGRSWSWGASKPWRASHSLLPTPPRWLCCDKNMLTDFLTEAVNSSSSVCHFQQARWEGGGALKSNECCYPILCCYLLYIYYMLIIFLFCYYVNVPFDFDGVGCLGLLLFSTVKKAFCSWLFR